MAEKILWKLEKSKLSDIKSYKNNPRRITKKGLADLEQSIDRFGLAEPIIINTDNTIIGGHARYQVLKKREEKECAVYVPSRSLTEKEVGELCVRLNKNVAGEFDFDILANEFEIGELADWGFRNLDIDLDIDLDKDNEPAPKKDKPPKKCPHCGELL